MEEKPKLEEPKDLGIKIAADKEDEFWIKVKEKCLQSIKDCEHEIIIQNKILELARSKIKYSEEEEKVKFSHIQ